MSQSIAADPSQRQNEDHRASTSGRHLPLVRPNDDGDEKQRRPQDGYQLPRTKPMLQTVPIPHTGHPQTGPEHPCDTQEADGLVYAYFFNLVAKICGMLRRQMVWFMPIS